MKEIWQSIPDFEDKYEVSSFGQIKSLARTAGAGFGSVRRVPERILKRSFDKDGYPIVALGCGIGKPKTFKVHRLVLLAFVGPLPDGQQSLHDDGNPENCRLDNLSYGTGVKNWEDRKRHGRGSDGVNNPNAKLSKEQVLEIQSLKGLISYAEIGRKFGISDVQAGNICKRETQHV